MTVRIVTDSGANSFSDIIGGVEHVNVPLTVMVNGQSWNDDDQLDLNNFLSALKNTKTATSSSCPNMGRWLQAFEGADEIFVLTITSALSGSYNAAVQAAEMYMSDHPDTKIHVFDSKSAGPQIRLLSSQLAVLVNHGYSFNDIIKMVDQQIQQTDLLFELEELNNLANNGRISPTIAKLTNLLKLHVYGTASDTGKFKMLGKLRGSKKMFTRLTKVMVKQGYDGGRVFIDHVNNRDGADQMAKAISTMFPSAIITISTCGALCSYYAENGGLMIGFEK